MKNDVTSTIVEKIKPTQDKITNMEESLHDVKTTLVTYESRHVENVEKIDMVTNITNTIQTQLKDQEQKILEQTVNGVNDIKEKLQDITNRTNVHSQEIETVKKKSENLLSHLEEQLANFEDFMDKRINTDIMPRIGNLDTVNQSIADKLLGFETDWDNKLKNQEEIGNSLINKIDGIDNQVHILTNTISSFESRHTETVEKFKEFNVITNTLQTQIKDHEQNMLQQNTTGLNQLREKLENIEVKTNVSNQEIEKAKKQTENLARHLDAQLAI